MILVLLVSLATIGGVSQEPSPAAAPAAATEKVHFAEKGITSPVLLPGDESYPTGASCKEERRGEVRLSMIVDSKGLPRRIVFERPLGNGLDLLALKVAEEDRFQPATLQGEPVAVGRVDAMTIRACAVATKDDSGNEVTSLKLLAQPRQQFEIAPRPNGEIMLIPGEVEDDAQIHLYRIGGKVSAPRALCQPEAKYSEYGSKKNITGKAAFSFIVDVHGIPRNIKLVRSLEPSMDENALEAVRGYRFKPAMTEGRPVAITVFVEVNFQHY